MDLHVGDMLINKPNSVRARCLLNPTMPVTLRLEESTKCLLLIDDVENGDTIHVEMGKHIYMKSDLIHFSCLEEGNVRVSVAAAVIKKATLQIPTEEAIWGLVKWPKRLIEVEISRESRGPIVKQASKPDCDSEPSIGDGKKIPSMLTNAKF